ASFGPDANSRGLSCPIARIFTCVPPTSTTSTFIDCTQSLSGLLELSALGRDYVHQIVPRLCERSRPFVLKLCCKRVEIDARSRKRRQHLLTIAAVRCHGGAGVAMVCKGLQSGFGHCVYGERRRERLDVQNVRPLGILRSSAGP